MLSAATAWAGCVGSAVDQDRGSQRVVSDMAGQDGVCTERTGVLNQASCAVDCCDAHDRCYAAQGCHADSWVAPEAESTCRACNRALLACLGSACPQLWRDAGGSPSGATCTTSADCADALWCEDFDCDGVGTCEPYRSGPSGACCTLSADCVSGLCLQGHCAPATP